MRESKVLFIILLLLGMVMGYLYLHSWQINKTIQSQKTLQQNPTIAKTKPTENITKMDQLGTNWKDFKKLGEGAFAGSIILTFVSDGMVIRDPIQIKTKTGEVLATSMAAFKGYYYDNLGKKQSIVVPMVLKLPDGKLYHSSYIDTLTWNAADLTQQIQNNPQLFGAGKGMVMQIGVYSHVPVEYLNNSANQSLRFTVLHLIDKYNKSWQAEVDKFYNQGDPQIGLVFTFNYFSPRKQDTVTF
jgi:hypothetical protein